MYQRARVLDGYVDAINATDGSGANCHMSSLAVCALLTRVGYAPVMQISCRDRNRIAIQGDILGGAAMGVCNMLCLTGDGVQAGDHPQAKPVFDLDSVSLLEIGRTLRDQHHFQSGRKLSFSPRVLFGAGENPMVPPLQHRALRLAKKVAAGAQFIQTQYVYDLARLREFLRGVEDLGLLERVFLLIGVGPIKSAKGAEWMRRHVPGVHIPDADRRTARWCAGPGARRAQHLRRTDSGDPQHARCPRRARDGVPPGGGGGRDHHQVRRARWPHALASGARPEFSRQESIMTDTVLSSATREVVIGFDRPFVIIGERINPTGRKILAAEMSAGDFSRVESRRPRPGGSRRAHARRQRRHPAGR